MAEAVDCHGLSQAIPELTAQVQRDSIFIFVAKHELVSEFNFFAAQMCHCAVVWIGSMSTKQVTGCVT